MLKELDDDRAKLSDEMLGDMMLDNAGINKTEKMLILTSTQNKTNIDAIEEALKKQHSEIHKSEFQRQGPRRTDYRKDSKKDFARRKQHYRFKQKKFVRQAFMAGENLEDADEEDDEAPSMIS